MADGKIRIEPVIDTAKAEADLGKLEGACRKTAANIQKTANTIFDIKGKPLKLIDVNSEASLKKAKARLQEIKDKIAEEEAGTDKSLRSAVTDEQAQKIVEMEAYRLKGVREEYDELTRRVEAYQQAKQRAMEQETEKSGITDANKAAKLESEAAAFVNNIKSAEEYEKKLDETRIKLEALRDASARAASEKGVDVNAVLSANSEYAKLQARYDALINAAEQFKSASGGAFGFASQSAEKVTTAVKNGVKQMAKYTLAIFGARSAFMGIKSLMSTFISNNTAVSNSIAGIKGALSEMLGPAIIWIVNLAKTAMAYINAFVTALTGINFVARWNAKALDKQTKATKGLTAAQKKNRQPAAFDEQNKLSSNTSSGSGSSKNSGILALPDVPEKALEKIKAFADALKSVWEWVKENKTALIVLGSVIAAVFAVSKIAAFIKKIGGLNSAFLVIVGLAIAIAGYIDAWKNGLNELNIAEIIGGFTAAIAGLYYTLGPLAVSIGAVVAGIALVVLGIKDFISNGATLENTILIIGGAIAVAIGLATGGLSVLASVIIGATVAVGAFVAALILEKPAIMSVEDAEKNLKSAQDARKKAQESLTDATLSYTNAVDAAENSAKALEDAEKKTGLSGAELNKQVQEGKLSYEKMTAAQKEVYRAYLTNEQKQNDLKKSQEDLKKATEDLKKAKKDETLASFENDLALAKESGSYDNFKKSVVDAYKKGTLTAQEARDLIGKSMSEMSDDAQEAFMKDIPNDIRNGLDPRNYETTRKKIVDWAKRTAEDIKNVFRKIKDFFFDIGDAIGNAIKTGIVLRINQAFDKVQKLANIFVRAINGAIGIINKIPGVNIGMLSMISIPKLARGGIVNNPGRGVPAIIGEAGSEAVLPLERNTEWMDMLADKINGGNVVVPIYLDGQLITRQVIDRQKKIAFAKGGTI